jgi:Raf kinase inhibitor-like YbhB/YbcL family protein
LLTLFSATAFAMTTTTSTLQVTSPAFQQGQPIPAKFTCDGANISPPLQWGQPPAGAKSLALIVDDPDAPQGTWVHWILFNLPPTTEGLMESASNDADFPKNALEGINDFRKTGYGGPCPPSGTHRYFFRLYALDTLLALPADAKRADVDRAMAGHVLAQGELMGTYGKRK